MALCNISRELLNTQTPDKYQHVAFYSQGPVDSTIIECLYTTAKKTTNFTIQLLIG